LSAGLHPDPLGSLQRSHKPLSWIWDGPRKVYRREKQKGTEKRRGGNGRRKEVTEGKLRICLQFTPPFCILSWTGILRTSKVEILLHKMFVKKLGRSCEFSKRLKKKLQKLMKMLKKFSEFHEGPRIPCNQLKFHRPP